MDDLQELELGTEPMISVFDIPLDTTPEEAAELLNRPYSQGFYVNAIVEWPGVGARVFLKRTASRQAAGPRPKPQSREDQALQFIRDNREMSIKQLIAALKAIGFPRGVAWITKKRVEIVRTDRRVT